VLHNLARNAVQALAADGRDGAIVTIDAAKRAATVSILVSDNGPGLPKAARDHLFEAFSGSATAGGTGLGLAIAKEIAQSHGGDVVLIESRPGRTAFEVTLPA
jgi:signal transduction histidine kinase